MLRHDSSAFSAKAARKRVHARRCRALIADMREYRATAILTEYAEELEEAALAFEAVAQMDRLSGNPPFEAERR